MHLRAYVLCVGACSDPVDSCSAYAFASASQLCKLLRACAYTNGGGQVAAAWQPRDYVTRTCHDYTFFQCWFSYLKVDNLRLFFSSLPFHKLQKSLKGKIDTLASNKTELWVSYEPYFYPIIVDIWGVKRNIGGKLNFLMIFKTI